MRSGTENVAGIYSMAKALEDNIINMESIHSHVSKLDKLLCDLLKEQHIDFKINGDSTNRAAGILNISISGINGEGLLNMLDMHDICISIGSACNSKLQERSHVLLAMGLDEERIDSSVRISIGRYNTEEDIRELVKWISNCHRIAKIAEA
jgi:cysteine desulfurase